MREALLVLIREITERRIAEGKHPTHATRLDIDRAVNTALNELFTEGKISVGQTMNDKWIRVNE